MTITSEKPNPQPLTADHSVHLSSASANQLTTEWSQWALRYLSCSEWGGTRPCMTPAVQPMMHFSSHFLLLLDVWDSKYSNYWSDTRVAGPSAVIFRITLTDSTTCTRAMVYATCKAGFNTFFPSNPYNVLLHAPFCSVSGQVNYLFYAQHICITWWIMVSFQFMSFVFNEHGKSSSKKVNCGICRMHLCHMMLISEVKELRIKTKTTFKPAVNSHHKDYVNLCY